MHATHRAHFALYGNFPRERKPLCCGLSRKRAHERHCKRNARGRAIHGHAAGDVEANVIVTAVHQKAFLKYPQYVLRRGKRRAFAFELPLAKLDLLGFHNTAKIERASPLFRRFRNAFDLYDGALPRTAYAKSNADACARMFRHFRGYPSHAAAYRGHPLHVLYGNLTPTFVVGCAASKLHHVYRITAGGAVLCTKLHRLIPHAKTDAFYCAAHNLLKLLLGERSKKKLYAAGTKRGRQILRRACGRANQPKIRGHAVLENIVDVGGYGGVFLRIIRAVEKHAPILKHLQKLVHLQRVKLADFIQEEHAAMCAAYRAGLWLWYALRA